MRKGSIMDIYLNFDGVLHPNEILFEDGCTPSLLSAGHWPLEHALLLVESLRKHPGVEIVLNTWWTFYLGLDACKDLLPGALADRVVGSTVQHTSAYWDMPIRLLEAERHIARRCSRSCVILDNTTARYRRELVPNLLLFDSYDGLGNRSARRSLERRLHLLEHAEAHN
jgi:hypothetical protein